MLDAAVLRRRRSVAWSVPTDTTAPNVSITSVSDTALALSSDEAGTAYYLINTSSAPLAGSVIEAGGGSMSGSFAAPSGATNFDLYTAHLATNTYYLHLTIKDAAGNYSADVPQVFSHTYLGIQFVGGTANSATTGANFASSLTGLTGGIDTQPRPGDLVIVYTGIAAGSAITCGIDTGVSTGWTSDLLPSANDVRDCTLKNFYKIMGPTPDTSVTCISGNNSSFSSMFAAIVLRGVHQTTPKDVNSVGTNGINGAPINSTAITPVTAGACIVSGGINTGTGTPTAITAAPAGFTNLVTTMRNTPSVDANIAIAIQLGWTSGAVDPGDFIGATLGVDDSMAAISMAIRPAA